MFILKALRCIKLHEIPTRIFFTPTENDPPAGGWVLASPIYDSIRPLKNKIIF